MKQVSSKFESFTALDEEHRQALLLVASGASLKTCLNALTLAAGRLIPGTRACVLLANAELTAMDDGYSSHFPAGFAAAIRGLPIGEAFIATAVHEGRPVVCADVERALEWDKTWRALCLENDIRAYYAHPTFGQGGKTVGFFCLCFSEAREPTAWEQRVTEFGALVTSIVVERDGAAVHLRNEVRALARLQELSAELVGPGELDPLLKKILAAAADISGTDKGNIQIFDPVKKTLRIAVHQGLSARFVEHFAQDGWDASCGEAAKQARRLVVEDVEQLKELEGTLGLEIVRGDDIRSIQCTPLISRSGQLLGMLNNHYRQRGGPTPDALRYIDLLARQAAELIERHLAESELIQERKHKDEFLAILAHELRNPLAALHNMLEIQKRTEHDSGATKRAREGMERQLKHLVRLVDDLLDINRINRGKMELRIEALTLDNVLQQAVESCRPMIERLGHRLKVEQSAAAITLLGDSARLAQVFSNLLSNAAKYTPPGGDIELIACTQDNNVEITVRDNGSGIPPDQLDNIFEMFTQVDRTLERAQGGLGIGLMLVKRLVEMHGGSVQAYSGGLGKGSSFVVRLPVAASQDTSVPERKVRGPSVSRRILLVDDNRDAVESLVVLLEMEGHQVSLAYDGARAIELAEEMRPEVILMDIGLPGMSGHEACRRIRQQEWGRQLTILAFSGWGQTEDRQASLDAGFDAHLAKPIDLDSLLEFLSSVEFRGHSG